MSHCFLFDYHRVQWGTLPKTSTAEKWRGLIIIIHQNQSIMQLLYILKQFKTYHIYIYINQSPSIHFQWSLFSEQESNLRFNLPNFSSAQAAGASVICGDTGFMMWFQSLARKSTKLPVILSSLAVLPAITCSYGPEPRRNGNGGGFRVNMA